MASPTSAGYGHSSDEILKDYFKLVERYSHRSLTFGSDKLPAFSGVCQRLGNICLRNTWLACGRATWPRAFYGSES
jgi:hypothetical protein